MLTSEPRPAQPFCDAQWRSTPRTGIRVEPLLTDNAKMYRCSHVFRATAAELGLKQRFTRPRRPQTNGKVERYNRTLLEEWTTSGSIDQTATGAACCQPGSTGTIITGPT